MSIFDRSQRGGVVTTPIGATSGGGGGGGGGGASTALDNLASVSINSALIFQSGLDGTVQTKASVAGSTNDLNLSTGTTTFFNASSGSINIFTPDYTADDVISGNISIKTGSVRGTTGGPVSGNITLETGAAINNGVGVSSGDLFLKTGDSDGDNGDIYVVTGSGPQGGGHIHITSGNATDVSGNSGDITISTGSAVTAGNRGSVTIDSLTVVLPPINSSLVSSSPNNFDLGASSSAWQQCYVNLFKNASDDTAVFDVSAKQLYGNNGVVAISFGIAIALQTAPDTGDPTGTVGIFTGGDQSGDEVDTGDIYGSTGNSTGGNSGNFSWQTGESSGANPGKKVGDFIFQTGAALGTSNGGSFSVNVTPVSGSGSDGSFSVSAPSIQISAVGQLLLESVNGDAIVQTTSDGNAILNGFTNATITSQNGDTLLESLNGVVQVQTSLGSLVLSNKATDPTVVYPGSIYFNTTINKIKVYNGTSWETVTSV